MNIQRGGDGEEETGHGTHPTMGNTKLILVNFNALPHSINHLTTERRPSGPKNNLLIRIRVSIFCCFDIFGKKKAVSSAFESIALSWNRSNILRQDVEAN